MKFGLKESDVAYIADCISKIETVDKAVIFGSRAKGNYKPGSDVDIALFGKDITFTEVSRLHALLEDESPMPYMFDIIDYAHTEDAKIKEHIDRVGIPIYEKSY